VSSLQRREATPRCAQSGPGLKAGHETRSRGLRTCSSLCSTFCFLASISSDALTRPPSAFSFQVDRWYRTICFIFSVSYVVNVATLVAYPLVNLLGTRSFIFAVLDQPASMRLTDATFQAPMFWLNTAAELSISSKNIQPSQVAL
jgi:hypothetical protein